MGGEIEKFNIQSGIHRGNFIDSHLGKAHSGSVQAAKCDSSNSCLVSASLDGFIKVIKKFNDFIVLAFLFYKKTIHYYSFGIFDRVL